MPCTEAYKEHIMYTFNGFCKTVIRFAAAASPGRVFTKAQIFESVWSMESESCQSSVASVICNLRKKIEPDSKNPTYIKTVLGIGYKFASGE